MSLHYAAESYGTPSSSTHMFPASSDAPSSSSSHAVGTEAATVAKPEAESADDSAAAAEEEEAGNLESASMGISEGHSLAETEPLQSSSSHAEALTVPPLEEGRQILVSIAAAVGHTSSPLAESAGGVSCLDSFLHTVTTADQVLNDLLGELPSSSSSSPAQLSRQSSSSALPILAGGLNSGVRAVAKPSARPLAPPTDGAFQSSSSSHVQLDAAGIHASSSPAAVANESAPSDLNSPRSTTDAVLDSLLEDLRSAELTRHSSSSALLTTLNSLAELRRSSASSSPVAGTSQADILRQPSSSAELPVHQPSSSAGELPVHQPSSSAELPVMTLNCSSADPNAPSASSSISADPKVLSASSSRPAGPSDGITCSSSSPVTLAAGQELPYSSSHDASSSFSASHKALRKPDQKEDGQDCAHAVVAPPVVKKDARDEGKVTRVEVAELPTVTTRDWVLDELLDDAQVAPEPDSTANQVNLTLKRWGMGVGVGGGVSLRSRPMVVLHLLSLLHV